MSSTYNYLNVSQTILDLKCIEQIVKHKCAKSLIAIGSQRKLGWSTDTESDC
jgi:hypothetical protein